MKNKKKNILIAFLLNFSFSIIEFFGGILTNSTAIMSDAIHDLSDALSIGISYVLEKKSEKNPDKTHTYGYSRYSILGAIITSLILTIGSLFIIGNAISKLFNPYEIHYNGMIILAILGFLINLVAALKTSGSHSLNEKSVNLHMLEDTLGWGIVLLGGIIMKFTNLVIIDPLLSIGLSLFILNNVRKNVGEILDIFLLKVPEEINIKELEKEIENIPEVSKINNIQVWKLDENNIIGNLNIIGGNKEKIKEICKKYGINCVVIEEMNEDEDYHFEVVKCHNDHHHHHHHH